MSGLFALLDDVAALVRLTAASLDDIAGAAGRAGVKAAGVVVDDAAVTPRYVQGLEPKRELSIIGRIARGSLRNKLLFILPAALLLSQFAPWLLTPILMLGGAYLCYEGAEKIWELLSGHHPAAEETSGPRPPTRSPTRRRSSRAPCGRTSSCPRRSWSSHSTRSRRRLLARAVILVLVAIAITALVYGAVALIVKMDDVGLSLASRRLRAGGALRARAGPGHADRALGAVHRGIAAMLWVGGHILLVGVDELGFAPPYAFVHHLEVLVHDATGPVGGFLGWLTNTVGSAIVGAVVGAVIVAVMHLLPKRATGAAHA